MYKRSIAALLLVSTLIACPAPVPSSTAISLTPSGSASVNTSATLNVSALVTGTGSFNNAVTWSKISGGGSISPTTGSSTTFTAPATADSTVVRATSVQDTTKSASITITTTAAGSSITAVTITPPANTTLNAGATLNLAVTVTGSGSFNNAVTWSKVSGTGTLSNPTNTGATFTAVSQATSSSTVIRATSVQDSSKFNEITLNTNAQASGDTTPPKISVTTAISSTTVHVTFDEPLAPASIVTEQFKIGLPSDLAVTNAVLSSTDNKTVILTTAVQVKNQPYAVVVNNVAAATKVTDLAGNQYQTGVDVNSFSASFDGF